MIGIGNAEQPEQNDATDTNLLLLSALAPDPAISESAAFRSSHARRESAQQYRRDRPDEAHRDTSRGISSSAGIAFACRCPGFGIGDRQAGPRSGIRVTGTSDGKVICLYSAMRSHAEHQHRYSPLRHLRRDQDFSASTSHIRLGCSAARHRDEPLFWIMIRVPSCWS